MINRDEINSVLEQIKDIRDNLDSQHREIIEINSQVIVLPDEFKNQAENSLYEVYENWQFNLKKIEKLEVWKKHLEAYLNPDMTQLDTKEKNKVANIYQDIVITLPGLQINLDGIAKSIHNIRQLVKAKIIETSLPSSDIEPPKETTEEADIHENLDWIGETAVKNIMANEKIIREVRPIYHILLEGTLNLSNEAKSRFSKSCLGNTLKQSSDWKGGYITCLETYMDMNTHHDDASFDLYKNKYLGLLKENEKNNVLSNEIETILNSPDITQTKALDIIHNLMILNYLNDNDRSLYIDNMNSLAQTWNLLQNYEINADNIQNESSTLNLEKVQLAKSAMEKNSDIDEVINILNNKQETPKENEKTFATMTWTIEQINDDLKEAANELANTPLKRPRN